MSRPRPPLPPELEGRVFRVRQARAAGVPWHQLRPGPGVHRVITGVRSPAAATTVEGYAAQAGMGLPEPFAFSHVTAGRLWRLPLPTSWHPSESLHVMRPSTRSQVRRSEITGHRGLEKRKSVLLRGLPVTDPVWTWADLASLLRVDDLVVAGDALVSRTPALLEEMRSLAEGPLVRRGVRSLREALALLRVGSGSAMETRARLAFLRAGLPEPELNATVLSADDGQFLARVDFLWRQARVIVEYEGDHHRTDRRQWQNDIARTRLLESEGWTVVRVTALDFADAGRRRQLMALLSRLLLSR